MRTQEHEQVRGQGGPDPAYQEVRQRLLAARPSAARCLRCERMAERHELHGQEPLARDLPSIVAPAGMLAQPGCA